MANIDVTKNPMLITAADTNDNTLVFKAPIGKEDNGNLVAYIKVISGTFKFSVDSTADSASCPTWVDDEQLILTFNTQKPIHFKAANSSETFKIAV